MVVSRDKFLLLIILPTLLTSICSSISLAVDELPSKELQNKCFNASHSAIKNDSFSEDTFNVLELHYKYSFDNLMNKYFGSNLVYF